VTPQERYLLAHPDRRKVTSKKYYKNHRRKLKVKAKKRRATEEHRRKQRDYMLEKNYGISRDQYNVMLDEQGGTCFICLQGEKRLYKGKPTNLVVDHNHQTGTIRKILCHGCNAALGFLEENPDRMRRMAEYVEMFKRSDDGRNT
jgi:hypothetical protein